MQTEQFENIINNRIEKCKSVLCSKAEEYATDDRLHNFKVAGELQKCTPVKALGGMMAKHTVSVYDLIEDYEQGKEISPKMWAEKIGDSINYLLLLTALLEEDKNFEPMKREMTYEQTIEVITNAIQKDEMTVERDMALAIVQKTLKKQIPKKIEFDGNQLICPNCGNGTDILFGDKYCVECGQHLDWSWAIQ